MIKIFKDKSILRTILEVQVRDHQKQRRWYKLLVRESDDVVQWKKGVSEELSAQKRLSLRSKGNRCISFGRMGSYNSDLQAKELKGLSAVKCGIFFWLRLQAPEMLILVNYIDLYDVVTVHHAFMNMVTNTPRLSVEEVFFGNWVLLNSWQQMKQV